MGVQRGKEEEEEGQMRGQMRRQMRKKGMLPTRRRRSRMLKSFKSPRGGRVFWNGRENYSVWLPPYKQPRPAGDGE